MPAGPLLTLRQPSLSGIEPSGFCVIAFSPVVAQLRVIRGCLRADQDVAFNREPAKLQQIPARVFVTKHPGVIPLVIQLAPVATLEPRPGLIWMGAFRISHRALEHPVVEFAKRLGGNHPAIVIRPTPNNGIEPVHDRQDVDVLE